MAAWSAVFPRIGVVGGGVGLGQRQMVRRAAAMVPELLAGYLPDIDAGAMDTLVVPPALGEDAGPLGSILLTQAAIRNG